MIPQNLPELIRGRRGQILAGAEVVVNSNADADACGYADVRRQVVEVSGHKDLSFILQLNLRGTAPAGTVSGVNYFFGRFW